MGIIQVLFVLFVNEKLNVGQNNQKGVPPFSNAIDELKTQLTTLYQVSFLRSELVSNKNWKCTECEMIQC